MSEQEPPPAPAGPSIPINNADGKKYWEGVSADINGMLGGVPSAGWFPNVSKVDLQGSRSFLAKLGIGARPGKRRVAAALEGGAGIGRITEGLLLGVVDAVDVIEPVVKFTDQLKGKPGVRHVFSMGLEEWKPTEGEKYGLIWTQWCVGHLDDAQLVAYLEHCKTALETGGVIVIKENLSPHGEDDFDEEDSSVTREDSKFQSLFRQAGLQIVKMELQKGFPTALPKRLLPVKMYALKPKSTE
ncbi:alpha-N-methyltransferase NTM1 [Coniochaeta sp. 2T2.1]|nr:alpha-N-methyltransferase NTM1 [Coniochaeta sp. 2T2.1]